MRKVRNGFRDSRTNKNVPVKWVSNETDLMLRPDFNASGPLDARRRSEKSALSGSFSGRHCRSKFYFPKQQRKRNGSGEGNQHQAPQKTSHVGQQCSTVLNLLPDPFGKPVAWPGERNRLTCKIIFHVLKRLLVLDVRRNDLFNKAGSG